MAGVARLVIGFLFLLLGVAFLASFFGFIFGILFLIVGVVLILSGLSAREDATRMSRQQEQTNLLLQQQMQMTAMQMNRPAAPGQFTPGPQSGAPSASPLGAEKYCASCGGGNARAAAFCQRCGSPLPPPS